MAIKSTYDFQGRNTWALADRRKDTLPADKVIDESECNFWKFLQYLFFTQWEQMHAYAKQKGVALVGDMPIYVADDSADVWANPTMFCLNAKGMTKTVAGVPPDYFSVTGQLWGNPLYDWKAMKADNYNWWYERLHVAFSLFDIVRIDHFRGFCNYWSIPAGEQTAINGKWKNGPGADMFITLEQRFGYRLPLIAEDLGDLDAKVHKMLKKLGYPGMKVLQFAFDSDDSDYLPPHYTENCVVYTGTHDNRTTLGWLYDRGYDPRVRFERAVPAYRGAKDLDRIIRYALDSRADLCIIPMQDYLGLDDVARINTPGTLGDNWKWRLAMNYDKASLKNHIRKLTDASGRNQ
jgi:4-alpha-glucanotransferase